MEVAIIGAGIAGLACAARLAEAGCQVRLFDKGRAPGGRMSTRRVDLDGVAVTFDHGAQYFTARDPRFAAVVEQWAEAGLAARWPAAGPDAWVGVPGMNAPVRALAEARQVAWNRQVKRVEHNGRWRLPGIDDAVFDAVVVAIPAEQTAALLELAAPAFAAHAASVSTLPCWTMLAAFDMRLPLMEDVIRGTDEAVLGWAARDSAKPGRPLGERWVVQAGAGWSRRQLEDDATAVAGRLLQALAERAGMVLTSSYLTAHRWRYARTTATQPAVLWDADRRLGLCGDWCRGARVESAWLSGDALAGAMVLSA
jgi:predicted NAD/FAD-dependent oxidoreductase